MTLLRRYLSLSKRRRRLLLEGALALLAADAASRLWRGARLTRRLGTPTEAAPLHDRMRDIQTARDIGWAVTTAARHSPFRPRCLPQALAARSMLRRRQLASALYLGVARPNGPIAHAWVRAGGVIVSGGEDVQRYTVVSMFV